VSISEPTAMISDFIGQLSVVSFQLKACSSSSSVYRNRNETAMNRVQLFKTHVDSSGLMNGPPVR